MDNNQYTKYKDSFKKECIYHAIGSAFSVLTTLFIFFLSIFRCDFVLEGVTLFSSEFFSLFTVFKEIVSNIKSVGVMHVVILLNIVIFILGIIQGGIITFKNIARVMNLNDYSLAAYDDMKYRKDNANSKKQMKELQSNQLILFAAVFYLVIAIFVGKDIVRLLGEDYSNFPYMILLLNTNVINEIIILPLITLISSIVFSMIGNSKKKKIRVAILKER